MPFNAVSWDASSLALKTKAANRWCQVHANQQRTGLDPLFRPPRQALLRRAGQLHDIQPGARHGHPRQGCNCGLSEDDGGHFWINAESGTIQGDFGVSNSFNLIHGSDSPEAAEKELGLFFNDGEVLCFDRPGDAWVYDMSGGAAE